MLLAFDHATARQLTPFCATLRNACLVCTLSTEKSRTYLHLAIPGLSSILFKKDHIVFFRFGILFANVECDYSN
jgi:hypothetical protein